MAKQDSNFMFDVPNDEEGQKFLELMRKFKANGMGFRCYGRHSDRQTLKAQGLTLDPYAHNDVPSEYGEHIVVYGTRRNVNDSRSIFGPQDIVRSEAYRRKKEERRQRKADIEDQIARLQDDLRYL